MEFGSVPPDVTYAIGILFSFFLLVNFTGALLGFLMTKLPLDKIRIPKWSERHTTSLFGRVFIGVAFVAAGIWFSTIGKVILTGPVSKFYSSYNSYLYVGDVIACLIFGIVWLAIIIVEEQIA